MLDKPICEICGVKKAEYTCKDCGRLVCKEDYVPDLNVCIDCSRKYYEYRGSRSFSKLSGKKNIWKPTLIFVIGILALFFLFAIIVYPETGLIYLMGNLPLSRETLIAVVTMIIYPLILLVILGIFIKYIWLKTLS
jgi:type II secretory pathway component PulF